MSLRSHRQRVAPSGRQGPVAARPVPDLIGRTLPGELLAAALLFCAALLPGCTASAPHEEPAPAATEDVSASDERHASELLARLVAARGVSGREAPVREVVIAELARIEPRWQPTTDEEGNLTLLLGPAPPARLFIAHMDEIGLRVKVLRDDGLLECTGLGGFHDHLYRGTALELVTADGAVLSAIALPAPPGSATGSTASGVAGAPAAAAGAGAAAAATAGTPAATAGPAGSPAAAAPAVPTYLIDVGAHSADEARALGVAIGDTATVPKALWRLGSHRAAGRSNDDRVGCAAQLLALEALARDTDGGAELPRGVVFVWSTREEVGLEGADFVARTLHPMPPLVHAIDTFVTSDSPREDPHYAFAPLGDGPVLRALDNTSITPQDTLASVRALADRLDLPLQTGTMGGGNDGSRFILEGAIDCPLAWPQRNAHSRVETLDLRDLVELSRLVEALAREE